MQSLYLKNWIYDLIPKPPTIRTLISTWIDLNQSIHLHSDFVQGASPECLTFTTTMPDISPTTLVIRWSLFAFNWHMNWSCHMDFTEKWRFTYVIIRWLLVHLWCYLNQLSFLFFDNLHYVRFEAVCHFQKSWWETQTFSVRREQLQLNWLSSIRMTTSISYAELTPIISTSSLRRRPSLGFGKTVQYSMDCTNSVLLVPEVAWKAPHSWITVNAISLWIGRGAYTTPKSPKPMDSVT